MINNENLNVESTQVNPENNGNNAEKKRSSIIIYFKKI